MGGGMKDEEDADDGFKLYLKVGVLQSARTPRQQGSKRSYCLIGGHPFPDTEQPDGKMQEQC
jgi:hypothetical protein